MAIKSKYIVSLTLRGFEMSPEEVEGMVGVTASSLGTRGIPIKPNTRPLLRSVVQYERYYEEGANLYQMIPELLASVGGASNLLQVKCAVKPEFLEIDISLRVKSSVFQEGGFISNDTLLELGRLGAKLSFQFL